MRKLDHIRLQYGNHNYTCDHQVHDVRCRTELLSGWPTAGCRSSPTLCGLFRNPNANRFPERLVLLFQPARGDRLSVERPPGSPDRHSIVGPTGMPASG